MRLTCSGTLALAIGFLLLTFIPSDINAATPPTSQECLLCHGNSDLKEDEALVLLFVDEAVMRGSVHGRLLCVTCHKGVTASHEELTSRTEIEVCTACHQRAFEDYRKSIHGQSRQTKETEAATCTSCHGNHHAILANTDPQSPTYHLNLPRTCAQCHGDQELAKRYDIAVENVYQLYMDSIHGRAITRSGLLVAANCSSCHGAHDIRPPEDSASRVHRGNVPETCGGCHAGVLATYRESIHGRQFEAGLFSAPRLHRLPHGTRDTTS